MSTKAASVRKTGKLDSPGRPKKKTLLVIPQDSNGMSEVIVRSSAGKGRTMDYRITEVPLAQTETVTSLSELVERMTRESDLIQTGNLMIQVFESHVAAAAKPVPQSGLTVALLRGRVAREELKLEEGGSISSSEAAERLGISKTAVLKRYNRGQLIGWKEARQGAVRMPVWQFKDDNVLPGLPETLTILNQASWMDDWGRVSFFLNRRTSLGDQRPLDLLRAGKANPVLQAAMDSIE
jgi:hypothetical protein